jgi:hypothetical protein
MSAALVALLLSAAAASAQPGATAPTPTPIPEGIRATFVSLAESHGVALVTYESGGVSSTAPLMPDVVVRERPSGGEWHVIAPTDLRPSAPIVVFLEGGRIRQIDAPYSQVATRLVLVKNGFGVTPAGKIYKLVGRAAIAGSALPEGAYVLLRIDPATGIAFDLVASRTPFANPEAAIVRVTVTIEVLVPVNTPPTDVVYMAVDALSWTPNAIRMSPLPGNRWSASLSLTGGSTLKYKYTRGTWSTDERDAAGNEIPNRTLSVNAKGTAQTITDTVVRWADRSS